ncbi:SHIRT domain-containing protein, partial [Streptococcus oralis]|uniref:SHIRT domain-containing protein n=1 Tax=Streptococcus oralis TaxID=1303 RepID=UPI0039C4138B
MIKSKNRLKKTIVGMITFVLAFFLLPFQGLFAAPQEIKDDTDLSALSLYQFQLTTDNMSVVSKSSAVDQYHMNDPIYEGSPRVGTPMENFTLKVDKTKKADQTFDKPLSLKFTNAGTVNGKQVDAYLTINKVTLHYLNNSEAPTQMADANKTAVQFFNVSNTWGANQFEIGNIPYLDATHKYFLHNTFTVDADVTAELKYSDGSEPNMKLVMKPTDIDANGQWNTKEAFYVTNYNTSVDKRVMNNRNILQVTQEGDKTVWNAGPGGGTSGLDAENNISGLALRSVNNSMNFGYRSANHASATFSLYMEQVQFAPEKEVDPAQIPAQAGEAVTYKTLFRIPKPGKEIIAALSSLDFVDTFDDRLDFKDLTVDANGVVLTEGTDYTVEKSGQKVTVKMAAAYLNKDKAGTPIRITYNTVTNNKVGDKASGPIENIVAMQPDNLYFASNKVTTTLLYNKIHEFESGTPGKTLPQEVKNLLPAKVSGLANGTTVNPTQPTTTKVSVPEGNWVFKGYDKDSEVVENGDVKFIGKWEFTPAPTYKATHEFVSGTPGKELPQEVKSLLPADQTDLKDGSQATPTQPSQTEVKTAEGTWSFKSYDKASETINGADAHFVGTWEFTPAPTYKATHEFVSGTPGKDLPQEVKSLLPADQTDLKDGSQATPTQP